MKGKDLQILIADSNLATNLHLKIKLEKLGFSVIAMAENAFRLLYLLDKLNPNIIIIDTELLSNTVENHLKQLKTPILFTTCFGCETLLIRLSKQKNTIGYLVKPVDKFSLYSGIEWAVKFHLYNRNRKDILRTEKLDEVDNFSQKQNE